MDGLITHIGAPVYSLVSSLFAIVLVPVIVPVLAYHHFALNARLHTNFIKLFNILNGLPFGLHFLSFILVFAAPYSGSISASVVRLDKNCCVATLRELPWLKNPFNSVHAVAMVNLGEMTSGLLMMSSMQEAYREKGVKIRGIVKNISIEYMKKARGVITATATTTVEGIMEDGLLTATTELKDESGDVVAICDCVWSLRATKVKPPRQRAK